MTYLHPALAGFGPPLAGLVAAFELICAALLVPVLAMAAVRLVGERIWPAQPRRPARDRLNLFVLLFSLVGQIFVTPALGGLSTSVINLAGGGWIVLPSRGWGLWIGAGAYLIAMDLGEYLFHRAQHRWPLLWAMHSLHHSDTSFDSTTTVRHYWADPLLKSLTIWAAVGLVFKASPTIVLIYVAITLYNYLIHSNTCIYFGRSSWVLNSPAYHRLHHSASPEHFDCNFAALLPVFDVIAGSYRRPHPGERPATGLDSGDRPAGPLEAAVWPARALSQRRRAIQRPVGLA